MTRLRTEDIQHVPQELKAYDHQLFDKTGHTLKGIASHATGLADDAFDKIARASYKACVIPITGGQGVINGFSDTVSQIINHLGFHSFVAQNPDASGIAEAYENRSDIIFLADDNRFIAVNIHTNHVSDNSKMTARGFIAALDLMAGGLKNKQKNALVIGCGPIGRHAAKRLVTMGIPVSVCDINPQRTSALQKEVADELKTNIQIDDHWRSTPGKYQAILDATPSADVIDASVITPETCVVVPGVPCGLSPEAKIKLAKRYIHDPLQIGVATMLFDACKHESTSKVIRQWRISL